MPASRSQPRGCARSRDARRGGANRCARVCDASTSREPGGRPAVEHVAAVLARGGTDVDEPVRAAHHVEIVLDDEERIARGLQALERAEQRFAVGGMQAGGRLVEHVDDAEQVRARSASRAAGAAVRRTTASACCDRATDSRGRGRSACRARSSKSRAMRCAATRFSSDRFGVRRTSGAALCAEPPRATRCRGVAIRSFVATRLTGVVVVRRPVSAAMGASSSASGQRQRANSPMSSPANVTDSASRLQPLAVTGRAGAADHEARHALLHQRALRRRERVQHVAARAGERALVARLAPCVFSAARVSFGVKPA